MKKKPFGRFSRREIACGDPRPRDGGHLFPQSVGFLCGGRRGIGRIGYLYLAVQPIEGGCEPLSHPDFRAT